MAALKRMSLLGCTVVIAVVVGWVRIPARSAQMAPALTDSSKDTEAGASASTLWVLAIGVSRHQDPALRLQFADADARAVAAALRQQADTRLYRNAEVQVLTNEEVSRSTVLDSVARFLGRAGPHDVVVLFLAGHGVRDRSTRSYYFLPYGASAANHLTDGIRMSDFDETLRIVRRSARAVVLILDTCHAGAVDLSDSSLEPTDEPGGRLSVGEGTFLLAATKPGEDSQEDASLAHGVFTYVLLQGLLGAADTDHDGRISAGDLFGYVARQVAGLTGGTQHPYYKMEGTDIDIAVVDPARSRTQSSLPISTRPSSNPPSALHNSIAVLDFRNLRAEPADDWIGVALRTAFNTELSKVRALNVYAPELVDRSLSAMRSDPLATVRRLGIQRIVTGSFSILGANVRIDARIIDAAGGLQEGSDSIEGPMQDFFSLQRQLVMSLLRRLRVSVTAEEGSSIERKSNTDVDAYRLLLETEGELPDATPSPTSSEQVPGPQSFGHRVFTEWLLPVAAAAEIDNAMEESIAHLVERYRVALQAEDLERVASLYVAFPEGRRHVLQAYFDGAEALTIEIDDLKVAAHDTGMLISFTRRDHFTDRESGKHVDLEVRLTRVVVRVGGAWKIAGKP